MNLVKLIRNFSKRWTAVERRPERIYRHSTLTNMLGNHLRKFKYKYGKDTLGSIDKLGFSSICGSILRLSISITDRRAEKCFYQFSTRRHASARDSPKAYLVSASQEVHAGEYQMQLVHTSDYQMQRVRAGEYRMQEIRFKRSNFSRRPEGFLFSILNHHTFDFLFSCTL